MRKINSHAICTVTRARQIKMIVDDHYEGGRQDRCYTWVYNNYIKNELGIDERTFWRYMSLINNGILN
jgi:hypothetical protein